MPYATYTTAFVGRNGAPFNGFLLAVLTDRVVLPEGDTLLKQRLRFVVQDGQAYAMNPDGSASATKLRLPSTETATPANVPISIWLLDEFGRLEYYASVVTVDPPEGGGDVALAGLVGVGPDEPAGLGGVKQLAGLDGVITLLGNLWAADGGVNTIRIEGMKWRGEWALETAYKAKDVVKFDNQLWHAKVDNMGQQPPTGNAQDAYWENQPIMAIAVYEPGLGIQLAPSSNPLSGAAHTIPWRDEQGRLWAEGLIAENDGIQVPVAGFKGAYAFGERAHAHVGLAYAYYGGRVLSADGAAQADVAQGTIAVTDNATTLVWLDLADNTVKAGAAWPASVYRMASVTAAAGAITGVVDERPAIRGNGGAGGGATTLDGLSDVAILNPAEAHVIVYDVNSATWLNQVLQLDALFDVVLGGVALADGHVLTYDAGSGKWVNEPPAAGGSSDTAILSRVYKSTGGGGQFVDNVATLSKITFNTVDYDSGGNVWSTANNEWTVPANGDYEVTAGLQSVCTTSTTNAWNIAVYVNGVERARLQQYAATNQVWASNGHGTAPLPALVAGDKVDVRVGCQNDLNVNAGQYVSWAVLKRLK